MSHTDTPPLDLSITDVPDRGRFEARTPDGQLVGYVTYEHVGDVLVLPHTVVDPAFEGQGVASRMAAATLDAIRAKGVQVVATCPFMSAYIDKHEEYQDLLAQVF